MSFWGKKKLILVGEILSFRIICMSFLENLLEFFSAWVFSALSFFCEKSKKSLGYDIYDMSKVQFQRAWSIWYHQLWLVETLSCEKGNAEIVLYWPYLIAESDNQGENHLLLPRGAGQLHTRLCPASNCSTCKKYEPQSLPGNRYMSSDLPLYYQSFS